VGRQGGGAGGFARGRPRRLSTEPSRPRCPTDIVRVRHGYGLSGHARIPNIQSNTLNLWLDGQSRGGRSHIESQEEAQQLADACLFPRTGGAPGVGDAGRSSMTRTCSGEIPGQARLRHVATGYDRAGSDRVTQAHANLDAFCRARVTGITGGHTTWRPSLGHPGEPDHPNARLTADASRRRAPLGRQSRAIWWPARGCRS